MVVPDYEPSHLTSEPWGHMEPLWCAVWAYGFGLAVPLVACLIFARLSWRLSRRAKLAAAIEKDVEPVVGQRMVRGKILATEGPAVRVTITEMGTESESKNRWTTTWTEIERTVQTTPFVVETRSGRTVRVEPTSDVKLVDDLEPAVRTSRERRTRSAALKEGETAIVLGRIETSIAAGEHSAGFREPPRALVMRPDAGSMMISTHGLEAPLRLDARTRRNCAFVILATIVIAQLAAVRYHLALLDGHVAPAVVVSREQREVKDKKGSHYESTIVYRVSESGQEVRERVESRDYPTLTEGRTIPVRVSPLMTSFGGSATEMGVVLFLPTLLEAGGILFCVWVVWTTRPWYERKKLRSTRSGRLDDDLVQT